MAELLDDRNSRYRRLALAMIAARVLRPAGKLATSASLDVRTAPDTLNEELQLKRVDQNDLYEAMDWLHARKAEIETRLAERQLTVDLYCSAPPTQCYTGVAKSILFPCACA